ncbi:MAG: hypothetical protein ABS939_19320 [Psychrobacillus sp.]
MDKFMYEHLKNIEYLYGDDVYVQIPNSIFGDLSSNNSTNIQQVSFAYGYVTIVAFLYKYAHFVDIDYGTYIQNADIKQLLGYNRNTKTIDYIIRKNGVLDTIGLTKTIKDYPIRFVQHPTEKINNVPIREFMTINDIGESDINYSTIKSIVKNRNYTVKEPVFFFECDDDAGTLYNYANTHRVTLKELIAFIYSDNLDNIDFLLYCYFKSKCLGLPQNTKSIGLHIISRDLDIGADAFYKHLNKLKDRQYMSANHKGWVMGAVENGLDANEYTFKGI